MLMRGNASDSNPDRLHKNVIVRTDEMAQEEEEEEGIITDNETEESRAKRRQNAPKRRTSEVEDELDADS